MDSSSAIETREKYDVFISFRGTDTRRSFTSHLHAALIRMKIDAYIDYRLERGDDIGSALLKAIKGSKIYVIIFSQDYASSTWCLDELVHIMDCKERYKRIVIPIFYNIDPAVVRHQKKSYADAFAKHKSRFRFREEKLVEWKGALKTAADLSGFHSTSTTVRDDSELVEQVIKDIMTKLNRESSSDLTGLVGVESRIQQILLLLNIVPDDVRIRFVGIWGMGGIGKTTLANALFHGLSSQFEACCFLPNVRETSATKGGISPQLYNLRDILLRKLLGEGNVPTQTTPTIEHFVNERLQRTKVLVVLDDVDDWSQLEFLVGDQVSFGSGSRIIITTRDKRQLIEMDVLRKGADHDVKIYEVEELNGDEARQLFHVNAPGDICSAADSKEFLIKVIAYAAGNPLALKIWRSLFFRCKRKEDLQDLWNKLKKFPPKDLQSVCRISYEALEENEREIFLDMVCFHKGEQIVEIKRELDACGLFSNIGIEILIDMSLISIKYERLWIHDVIQEFGWDIVQKECPEEPGKRTRLYTYEDIRHVLENSTGTATVKSICLNTWDIEKIKLADPQVFTRMYNLIFLKFYGGRDVGVTLEDGKVEHFLDHESFPDSLRYFHWDYYPFESLPSQFSPKNLVELHVPCSELQRLWTDGQKFSGMSIRMATATATATVLSKDINPELFKENYSREIDEKTCWPVKSCVSCPGNEIPKWFSHEAVGSSININLPQHSSDETFFGFVVCAVGTTYPGPLECRYNFKFNNGQCIGSKLWNIMGWAPETNFAVSTDHVFVWYVPFICNDTAWCTEASFEFCDGHVFGGNSVKNVKRCGVCLLYAQGQDAVAMKTERPCAECQASGSEIVSDPEASEIQRPKRKTHIPGYFKDFLRKFPFLSHNRLRSATQLNVNP